MDRNRVLRAALPIASGFAVALGLCELVLFALLRWPAATAMTPDRLHDVIRSVYMNRSRTIVQIQHGRYDPEVLFTLQPGHFVFSNLEFSNEFRVNSMGLRDSEEALEAPELIVLGDSYAMGWGVDQEDTFAKRIEAATGLRTLNAAVSGYGTVREVLLFNRLRTHRLKYLVIQYCSNDFKENRMYESRGNRYEPPSEASWRGFQRQAQGLTHYFPGAFLVSAWGRVWDRLTAPLEPERSSHPPVDYFLNALAHANRQNLNQVQIIALELDGPRNRPEDYHLREVERRAQNPSYPPYVRHLRLLDLSQDLDPKRYYYALDDHLNREGHRLVAERVTAMLKALARR